MSALTVTGMDILMPYATARQTGLPMSFGRLCAQLVPFFKPLYAKITWPKVFSFSILFETFYQQFERLPTSLIPLPRTNSNPGPLVILKTTTIADVQMPTKNHRANDNE